MSRLNDHRYLDAQMARASEGELVVDRDRVCKGCGYDLTGLRYGGRCPECGKVIRYGRAFEIKERDRLQDAPRLYIRLVQIAFALLVVGAPGVIALALLLAGAGGGAGVRVEDGALWALPLTVCWSLGVGILSHPKPSTERVRRTLTDELPLRVATVPSAPMWLFAALLAVPAPWPATLLGMPLNLLLARAGMAIGLVGVGALVWLVSGFHEWMQDEEGAPRLRRRAFWLFGLGAVLFVSGSLSIPPGVPLIVWLFGSTMMTVLAIYLVVSLVWTFFTLARMAAWSVRIKDADAERAERLRARREAETAAERDRQSGHNGPDRVAGPDGRR